MTFVLNNRHHSKTLQIIIHIFLVVAKDHINPSLSTSVAEAKNVNYLDPEGPSVQFIVFLRLNLQQFALINE